MTRSFFDVPVYRLGEREYYRQREIFIESGLAPLREQLGNEVQKHRHLVDNMHQHLIDSYGGCWVFNEIVGYIRLHFIGTQVRGEYFAVARKRLVRSRTKRIDWRTHKLAMEVEIERPFNDVSILTAIRRYIERCRRELPRRHIDVAPFEALAQHVRWHDLWRGTNPLATKNGKATG